MKPATTLCMLIVCLTLTWACGGPQEAEESDHQEADQHDDHAVVHLDAGQIKDLGIVVQTAGPGTVASVTELPGEVRLNGDRMAHVAPGVGGVTREVFASLGDTVRKGQLLAVLSSRELADAKAALLAAGERLKLARATFLREERLWREEISSEQDYLDARRGLAEAEIERRATEQKLRALGFDQQGVEKLATERDELLTQYRLTAPFDGTIIDRHITIGETVDAGTPVFSVADLKTVWIDLAVYQRDIGAVKAGQTVSIVSEHGEEATLEIDFVQPLVGEATRTATARIIAANNGDMWHPGCFVTAVVTTSTTTSEVVVPPSAVIRMEDGDEVVFVEEGDGFEPQPVTSGRRSRDAVEIVSGIKAGERFVAEGGFNLKAELGKDKLGDGHAH